MVNRVKFYLPPGNQYILEIWSISKQINVCAGGIFPVADIILGADNITDNKIERGPDFKELNKDRC